MPNVVGFLLSGAGVSALIAFFGWLSQRFAERSPRRRVDAIRKAEAALEAAKTAESQAALQAHIRVEALTLLDQSQRGEAYLRIRRRKWVAKHRPNSEEALLYKERGQVALPWWKAVLPAKGDRLLVFGGGGTFSFLVVAVLVVTGLLPLPH